MRAALPTLRWRRRRRTMKPRFYLILYGLAWLPSVPAHAESAKTAANTEVKLKERCAAEAKALQTPDEEFDAYVEVCVEDLRKQLASHPGKDVQHRPMARTAD
jgi:hypothetical protein